MKLMMEESNEFHSICLGSNPPIRYLNEFSFGIIDIVNKINEKNIKCGYTFDAGCHAFLMMPT